MNLDPLDLSKRNYKSRNKRKRKRGFQKFHYNRSLLPFHKFRPNPICLHILKLYLYYTYTYTYIHRRWLSEGWWIWICGFQRLKKANTCLKMSFSCSANMYAFNFYIINILCLFVCVFAILWSWIRVLWFFDLGFCLIVVYLCL